MGFMGGEETLSAMVLVKAAPVPTAILEAGGASGHHLRRSLMGFMGGEETLSAMVLVKAAPVPTAHREERTPQKGAYIP